MPRVNQNSRYLCMASEGFAPNVYLCPAHVSTQGFGHTSMAGPPALGGTWTYERGAEIFAAAYEKYAKRAANDIGPQALAKLSDNQFGALVSFTYNVGSLRLKSGKPSGLLRAVQDGRYGDVPNELAKWTQAAGKTMPGLVRRRKAEALLFQEKSREAKALAGAIPLINSKGRISGTVNPAAFGKDVRVTDAHERAGEAAAPTATVPALTPENAKALQKETAPALTGGLGAGLGTPATAALVDPTLLTFAVVVGVIVVAGVGLWFWKKYDAKREAQVA